MIDNTTDYVENLETVDERLERAAHAMRNPARNQAGTDCGFDTSAGKGRVPEDVAWAKLRTIAEGARVASKRLRIS